MQQIATIAKNIQDGMGKRTVPLPPLAKPQPKKARGFDYKTLDQLTTKHLTRAQHIKALQSAIDGAKKWLVESKTTKGLSFVIAGTVGTGKTTICQNLKDAQKVMSYPLDDRGEPMLDLGFGSHMGKFMTATEAMNHLDPSKKRVSFGNGIEGDVGRASLSITLSPRNTRLVLIDDLGTEEIAYASAESAITKRQNRYRELFDYLYCQSISVAITSNVPFWSGDNVNQAFIDILGNAAFDRLWSMAYPYIYDLTGLPSYRQYSAVKSGRGQYAGVKS